MPEMVCVRPDWSDTACRWGAEQLKRKTIAYAQGAGWAVRDLYATDANKARIMEELLNVKFASLLGHGNTDVWTANQQQVVFKVGDPDTVTFLAKVKGRGLGANFLSCLMGQLLAKYLVDGGFVFVKAYSEEFVFAIDQANFPNSAAEPFFRCYCEFDRVYLNTLDEDKAWDSEQAAWDEEIAKVSPTVRRYLVQDKDCSWLHKVGHEPPAPPPSPEPCKYSKAVKRIPIIGPPLVWAYRKVRKALFRIEPGP